MVILVTCTFDENTFQNGGVFVSTTLSPLLLYGDNFRRSRASNSKLKNPIWLGFELISDFKPALVTRKFEEEPIKIECDSMEKPFSHNKFVTLNDT